MIMPGFIIRAYFRFVSWWLPLRSKILWVFGKIDPTDLWALDVAIAEFVRPRLEKLALDPDKGIPGSILEEYRWDEKIATDAWAYRLWLMIFAMQVYEAGPWDAKHDELAKAQTGLEFFSKHFGDLWT